MHTKNSIRQFFNGELHLCGRTVTKDSELRKASNHIGKLVDEWEKNLKPEEAERLREIVDALYRYSSILEEDTFEFGFRLGARMMIDVLLPGCEVSQPEDKP